MPKAWELLSDRTKWTKDAMARDSLGRPCTYNDEEAASFCMMAALMRCYPDPSPSTRAFDRVAAAIRERHGIAGLTWVNDMLGYNAVMQVLKEADV